jgi:virulence factor Mce-like protein
MITRRLVINLVVFFAVSAALIVYGVGVLLGNPFRSTTNISAVFPDASSIFPNFSVELNGVPVGTVTGVHLVSHGARVNMSINPGVQVPSNVQASIDIANDLGEQVVELTPTHGGSDPPLVSGAVVPVAPNSTPVSIGSVVQRAVALLNAIPPGKLNSLLATLATAFQGNGTNMRTFVSASTQFSREFLAYQSQFRALLANAPPLLNAMTAVGPQLQGSLANTQVLVAALATVRQQLDPLFNNSSQALGLTDSFVTSQSANLACVFHDLADLSANIDHSELSDLSTSLSENSWFFGAVDGSIQPGPAKGLSNNEPSVANQYQARTRLLIPPQQPSASAYPAAHGLNPVQPGAGCTNEFGNGVGPASQSGFQPAAGGQLIAPSPGESQVHGGS